MSFTIPPFTPTILKLFHNHCSSCSYGRKHPHPCQNTCSYVPCYIMSYMLKHAFGFQQCICNHSYLSGQIQHVVIIWCAQSLQSRMCTTIAWWTMHARVCICFHTGRYSLTVCMSTSCAAPKHDVCMHWLHPPVIPHPPKLPPNSKVVGNVGIFFLPHILCHVIRTCTPPVCGLTMTLGLFVWCSAINW